MTKFSFIYLISFILLWQLQGPRTFTYEKTPEFIQKKREELQSQFQYPGYAELLLSYVAGEYRKVPKEIKEAHKVLGLNHLFTPSGIHLSALFVLFLPLLFLLKKRSRKAHLFFASLLYLSPLFILPGFYAAKRISLLKFLSLFKRKIPFFFVFLAAFVLDFLLGGYNKSPGSFVYSFLFLGIIFASEKTPKLLFPLTLLGGQILVSFFQQTPLTPLGFLFGFFLTMLFTPLFPLYFFFFCFPSLLPGNFMEFFIKIYVQAILWSSNFCLKFGLIFVSLPLVLFVFVLSLRLQPRIKILILCGLFLCHSQPLLNAQCTKDLRSQKIMLYSPTYKKKPRQTL